MMQDKAAPKRPITSKGLHRGALAKLYIWLRRNMFWRMSTIASPYALKGSRSISP